MMQNVRKDNSSVDLPSVLFDLVCWARIGMILQTTNTQSSFMVTAAGLAIAAELPKWLTHWSGP